MATAGNRVTLSLVLTRLLETVMLFVATMAKTVPITAGNPSGRDFIPINRVANFINLEAAYDSSVTHEDTLIHHGITNGMVVVRDNVVTGYLNLTLVRCANRKSSLAASIEGLAVREIVLAVRKIRNRRRKSKDILRTDDRPVVGNWVLMELVTGRILRSILEHGMRVTVVSAVIAVHLL